MADTETTTYQFVKPEIGASADTWGAKVNTDLDDADALLTCKTTTGSANAYVLTTGLSLAAYVSGQKFSIKPNFTCSGAATLNVDGLGAKNIYKNTGGALGAVASGDIVSGVPIDVAYDGTQFVTNLNRESQPIDATLTALAALSWSSGNSYAVWTAADTIALTAAPQIDSINLGHATDTTLTRVSAGLIAVEGANVPTESRANTFSAKQTFSNSTTAIELNSTVPRMLWIDSDAGANITTWDMVASSTAWLFRTRTDADGAGSNIVTVTRSGGTNVASIVFGGPVAARVLDSSETTGSLTSASANRRVVCSGGVTLPSSGMTSGDFILIDPAGTARVVTRPGSHTMYVRDTDSATDTTYAHNTALAIYHGSSKWTLHGMP